MEQDCGVEETKENTNGIHTKEEEIVNDTLRKLRSVSDGAAVAKPRSRPNAVLIKLIEGQLGKAMDEVSAAIGTTGLIFHRERKLVEVVDSEEDHTTEHFNPNGAPIIEILAPANLKGKIADCIDLTKFDRRLQKDLPKDPSDALVYGVATSPTRWRRRIPELKGITTWPIMRPDGTLWQTPGYDPITKRLYRPNARYLPVADCPSQDECHDYLQRLKEPLKGFIFAKPSQIMVPILATATILARPAIRGAVPGFFIDASCPGSGKTLLTMHIGFVATGLLPGIQAFPKDEAELWKVLGSHSLHGTVLVTFDNITGLFGGEPLDVVLSCPDKYVSRILGLSKSPSLPWIAVVIGSGNNLMVKGDTARRILMARIDPGVEDPENRIFEQDLLEWDEEHRVEQVYWHLSILQGYIAAGRPYDDRKPLMGGFEGWSKLIRGAYLWAGGEDAFLSRPDKEEIDPATEALEILYKELPRFMSESRVDWTTTSILISSLWSRHREEDIQKELKWRELRESLAAIAQEKGGLIPGTGALSRGLRKYVGCVRGQKKLVCRQIKGCSTQWRIADI